MNLTFYDRGRDMKQQRARAAGRAGWRADNVIPSPDGLAASTKPETGGMSVPGAAARRREEIVVPGVVGPAALPLL